jgi:hypothetical protein
MIFTEVELPDQSNWVIEPPFVTGARGFLSTKTGARVSGDRPSI